VVNNDSVDRAFVACSHPLRRAILERLVEGEMTVGEATRDFPVSKPAITKHLKVLEQAGAIIRVIDGRTHRLRLPERPLEDAWSWMAQQRRLWERKFDVVEQYLQEEQHRHRQSRKDAT
jgi:DNA-binding transcriptional ArsR family regulator